MDEQRKIRSIGSIKAQTWICGLLLFPVEILGILSFCGWLVIIGSMIDPVAFPSVPKGRHNVWVITLATTPALILAPLILILLFKSWKLMDRYYGTFTHGVVSGLAHTKYQGYAVVKGTSLGGAVLTKKVAVPLDMVPTLKVGDPYPW